MDLVTQQPLSWFAPAGRATHETLQQESEKVANSELVAALLNAMPDLLLVLNQQRQIVTVNQRLLKIFGVADPESLLGLRPGEAVGCTYCHEGPDGCGTAAHCSVCGAVRAILASQANGQPEQGECQLMLDNDGCSALDLDVLATPVTIEGEQFTVLALRDISSEKRRHVMERVFFHDILNSAGGIRGLASLLQEGTTPVAEEEYKGWMVNLADNLIEEINHQRRLLDAEQGTYKPDFVQVDLSELLHDVQQLYEHHERVPDRKLMLELPINCSLTTDRSLLRRIVGNMVLNALEASKRGDTVIIGAHCLNDRVYIQVTNPGEMTSEVQLQIFKRSFSTKEKQGRGLGTYCMKLFGERYLGGTVSFNSADEVTVFTLALPLKPVY
ncbi:MAG: ATP-binding protein [Trichlorobacter sp.]|uniref:ATP-binding protein n=1 Tax=Trichlorobacter sp. TaxID=2911007 RepID=UPI00255DBA88|nr:ATP-binding protein [Trichlorobacter sp.]MDK9719355.1 ATP-binding protein [Trichlorobacter sp.]